jgi:hypothetical protein
MHGSFLDLLAVGTTLIELVFGKHRLLIISCLILFFAAAGTSDKPLSFKRVCNCTHFST